MTEALARNPSDRRDGKSATAFRTISEVAAELDVPTHVLRFWETKFAQVKPLKRGGGRRYYRPEDIALLRNIRSLLYDDGYTIKGVQKLLREGGKPRVVAVSGPDKEKPAPPPAGPVTLQANRPGVALSPESRGALLELVQELEALRDLLRQV
jgi:DNA-binding transcriptional MerR regulator